MKMGSCRSRSRSSSSSLPTVVVVLVVLFMHVADGQQPYINNKQDDCYDNSTSNNFTNGYFCNGARTSCSSYLAFRSNPLRFDTAAEIGTFLGVEASSISDYNNLSSTSAVVPKDTILFVPIRNCSCSSGYYQYNTSYVLQSDSETYFIVANDTYEGLTTCQALIRENPQYDSYHLTVGMNLTVPLRCACPTSNQTASGVKYLLTYLITWDETFETIAQMFGVDKQLLLDANELSSTSLIFPFTSLLIPLSAPPEIKFVSPPPPPSPPPPTILATPSSPSSSSKKWVYVGVGIGAAALLLLALLLGWVFCIRKKQKKKMEVVPGGQFQEPIPVSKAWSVSSEGIRYAIESMTVYKLEDLQRATNDFSESNRIKGSVYRGLIKGDDAAIKIMKGDVSSEIKILKQINHTNIIRLSGFCVNEGNTYLVYEYAENNSLSDWLHLSKQKESNVLGWKQRMQIAYDTADALNYLHNYTNPPYIHKNLKSSNILLDFGLRAKVANFGLARSVEYEEEGGLQLTRHVVGTHGYMAPEYIENGVITPKMDVFAFGVVLLEILSGRNPITSFDEGEKNGTEESLWVSISQVLEGENVREKLKDFVDPNLKHEYPLDLAFSLADLANKCISRDLNSRPTMSEVFMTLSKIVSSSLDWDPSDELDHSRSS